MKIVLISCLSVLSLMAISIENHEIKNKIEIPKDHIFIDEKVNDTFTLFSVKEGNTIDTSNSSVSVELEKQIVPSTITLASNTTELSKEINIDLQKGEKLFATCATCHGKLAEKSALNKSQIIASWDATTLIASLKGYKDNTYGGTMKGLMVGQLKNLGDEDIVNVSHYIVSLKDKK